jgi:hypothetical protein
MRRTFIALILAPLLVSAPLGAGAFFAFPVMLVVTIVITLPLLLILKRIRWLNWWIALISGAFCAMCAIVFSALTPLTYGVAPNFDRLVNPGSVSSIGIGMLTAFIFWWMGIFRNATYPFVPRRFPISALLTIPLFVGCSWVSGSLVTTYDQGRIISIEVLPTGYPVPGQATVQLTHGPVVHADISEIWMAGSEGRCVDVESRWSTYRFRRIYDVDSTLGGDSNEC